MRPVSGSIRPRVVVLPTRLVLLGAVVVVQAEQDGAGGLGRRAQVDGRLAAPRTHLDEGRRRRGPPGTKGRPVESLALVVGHETLCRPGQGEEMVPPIGVMRAIDVREVRPGGLGVLGAHRLSLSRARRGWRRRTRPAPALASPTTPKGGTVARGRPRTWPRAHTAVRPRVAPTNTAGGQPVRCRPSRPGAGPARGPTRWPKATFTSSRSRICSTVLPPAGRGCEVTKAATASACSGVRQRVRTPSSMRGRMLAGNRSTNESQSVVIRSQEAGPVSRLVTRSCNTKGAFWVRTSEMARS